MKKKGATSREQPELKPNDKSGTPKVKRIYTRRLIMLAIGGIIAIAGIGLFAIYCLTQNMAFGAPSILMIGGGFLLFKYYWGRTDDAVIEHIGKVNKAQVNSLCLYPGRLVFEDVYNPEGFPQQCLNDKKKYFVLIWEEENKRLVPFVLPDQQYYDPSVFAERVLELPAHQKIFTRKPKLLDKIKTGLLVIAIGIVWLLILTTTG